MNDEFIHYETWYFTDTRESQVRALYPEVSEKDFEFIMEKYCGLHIMHLVADVSELQSYFEDMFTKSLSDTAITRKLHQGRILGSRDGNIVVLVREGKNGTIY